jgi:hypothetical protein
LVGELSPGGKLNLYTKESVRFAKYLNCSIGSNLHPIVSCHGFNDAHFFSFISKEEGFKDQYADYAVTEKINFTNLFITEDSTGLAVEIKRVFIFLFNECVLE